jgi:hypothetical protein
MVRRLTSFALCLLMLPSLTLAGTIVEKKSKQEFPDTIQVEHGGKTSTLRATGTALRKKIFWKVYAVVGYIDESVDLGEDPGRAIVAAEVPKEVHLRMLRDVDSEKISNGINEALEKCAVVPYDDIAEQRAEFLSIFGDDKLMKGDDLRFLYTPERGLEVSINDDLRGTIAGEDFGRSFFAIYYGDPPVDDGMKEHLLSAITGEED